MKTAFHSQIPLLLILALLLAVPEGWAQQNNRKQAETYYQQALDVLHYNWPAQGSHFSSARALFEKAMAADETFAPAYARAALTYKGMFWDGEASVEEATKKAWWAANKAMELDPDLAEAHVAFGMLKMTEDNMKGAETSFKKAIALDPNDFDAHREYAWWFSREGRYAEAAAEARKALELDPKAILVYEVLGAVYREMGAYDKAVEVYNTGIKQCSGSFMFYQDLAYLHIMYGHFDKAITADKAALDAGYEMNVFHNQIAWAQAMLGNLEEALEGFQKTGLRDGEGWVLGLMGRKQEAMAITDELKQGANKDLWWNHWNIAYIYLGLGENSKALDWLESSLDLQQEQQPGTRWWGWRLTIEEVYDPIRSEPRFKALIKKTGYKK